MKWGLMQERVYQKPVRDVDELKQRLTETEIPYTIQQSVIDQTIDQWRHRHNACIKAKVGKHFEHLMCDFVNSTCHDFQASTTLL